MASTDLTGIQRLLQARGYAVELEYPFAKALGRRWRFDLAIPMAKLALEVDGGLWTGGRHARGSGIVKQHEKENAAAAMGWRICKCQPRDVRTLHALAIVEAALTPTQN